MSNYRKFDSDRTSINTAAAINSPGTRLSVGNITEGEVVTVQVSSGTEGSVSVKARRVGAILIGSTGPFTEFNWRVEGTKLLVEQQDADARSYTFWVF